MAKGQYQYMQFERICEQWGKWATPRLGTEFPCVSAGIQGAERKQSGIVPISDEFGLLFDELIITMHKHTPELYEVFMLRYVYRDDEAFKRLNISRKQFYIQLACAKVGLKLMLARMDYIFSV